MLYTNLITTVIAFFLNSHYSGKMVGYSSWMQIKDVAPSYGIAIVVALSVFFLKFLPITNWVILPLQGIIGLITFIMLCRLFHLEEFDATINMLKPLLRKAWKS